MAPERVVVFFDWQNVYKRAREAFHDDWRDPSYVGQADPVDLAHVLVKKMESNHPGVDFELGEIRIYRGRPTQQHQQGAYNAFQRQVANWARNNKVRPTYKDLRYPDDWGQPDCDPPREKGIDVALAVDLVTMAQDGLFDVAIVMSADFDLVPAIEQVHVRWKTRGRTGPRVEVAAWKSDQGDKPLRIHLPHDKLWCIWLDRQDFWAVEDKQDYTISTSTSSSAPKPGPPRFNG